MTPTLFAARLHLFLAILRTNDLAETRSPSRLEQLPEDGTEPPTYTVGHEFRPRRNEMFIDKRNDVITGRYISIPALAELIFNIGGKFTNTVDNNSYPSLGDYALIPHNCDRRIIWFPSCADCASSKCRRKRHDVWSDGLFTVVIGYEVSDESVPKAWPRPCAPATVIARFPLDDPLTQ